MADEEIKQQAEETAPTGSHLILTQAPDDENKKMTLDTLLDAFIAENMYWEFLGQTVLGATADVITVNFEARRHLLVLLSGFADTNTLDTQLRVNGDSSNQYAWRTSSNHGATNPQVNQSSIPIDSSTVASTLSVMAVMNIFNQADREKLFSIHSVDAASSGAGTAPNSLEIAAKWTSVLAQITSISWHNLAGAGDFGITSRVVVLGHD